MHVYDARGVGWGWADTLHALEGADADDFVRVR